MSLWSKVVAVFMVSVIPLTVFSQNTGEPDPIGYKVLPGDELEISVWQEEELQRSIIVRPDGRFSFPLVGDVVAIGKTVPELQATLEKALISYIPDISVLVSVTNVYGNRIYVIGQINDPGSFVVNPRVDVVQALSLAGGLTPFAAANDIIILRRENGVQRSIGFRYGDVEKGRNLEQNVLLEPGDIVVVP